MIRLGLVGVNWGSKYITTIASMDGVRLTAVCRQSNDKLNLPSDCYFSNKWKDFVDRAKDLCDGVIIATPPHLHVSMATDLFKQRLPVLIEKPICLSKDDLDTLNRRSTKYKTSYMVGYTHLYSEAYRMLKSMVKPPITAIQSWGMNAGPYRVSYSSLFDYGPHDLSMCVDLTQSAPEVSNVRCTRTVEGEIYDLALRFRNTTAVVRVGNGSYRKKRLFQVFSESGLLEYDDTKSSKLTLDGRHVSIPDTKPLDNVIRAFSQMIQGDPDKFLEPGLSMIVTSTLEDAYDFVIG